MNNEKEIQVKYVYNMILNILVDYDYAPSRVIRLLQGYDEEFLNTFDEYCIMQKDPTSKSIRDYIVAVKNWKKECQEKAIVR